MCVNEFVILQVMIKLADAIDLLCLTGGQIFVRIETPAPFEKTLPSQNFVDARNASMKIVNRIEQRRICVGDLLRKRQQIGRNIVHLLPSGPEMSDSLLCPYCPVAQQAAGKTNSLVAELIGSKQVEQNIIVIAGIQGDLFGAPRFGKGANYFEGLIAIERRHLDGYYVFDITAFMPESVRKNAPTDAGLEVKSDDGHDRGNGSRVLD